MKQFDHIAIVFNPESTGDAPAMAKKLAKQVKDAGLSPTLVPTKHAGHAMEIAEATSKKYSHPLIISVSGDGGYNEVINGAMQAKNTNPKAHPVVAVVGAGNANDHQRVTRSQPLIALIKKAEPKPLDLLHVAASTKSTKTKRYAHSYIGFGLTSEVGHQLNLHGKSTLDEVTAVVKTLSQLTPFTVLRNNKKRRVYSLVFANISEMAKYIKLDKKESLHDGQFELVEIRHRSKLWLLVELLGSLILPTRRPPSYQSYSFSTTSAAPVQLDGEIVKLPKRCDITITSHKDAIESLY